MRKAALFFLRGAAALTEHSVPVVHSPSSSPHTAQPAPLLFPDLGPMDNYFLIWRNFVAAIVLVVGLFTLFCVLDWSMPWWKKLGVALGVILLWELAAVCLVGYWVALECGLIGRKVRPVESCLTPRISMLALF